jgi:hypothetical protein
MRGTISNRPPTPKKLNLFIDVVATLVGTLTTGRVAFRCNVLHIETKTERQGVF